MAVNRTFRKPLEGPAPSIELQYDSITSCTDSTANAFSLSGESNFAGQELEPERLNLPDLVKIAKNLSSRSAQNPTELNAKIKLWRVIAPEDSLNVETATIDEVLLSSILQDFESFAHHKKA